MRNLIFVTLCLLGALQNAGADTVAMAFYVTGKVEAQSGASPGWKPVTALQRFHMGDQIRCSPGGQAGVVNLADGSRYLVTAGQPALVQANTVQGAMPLGKPRGLSANVAEKLAGRPTGAHQSRGSTQPQDLKYHFDGWLPAGARTFSWADPRVFDFTSATYSFALFDRFGDVVWSIRTGRREANVPAAIPDFDTRRPYLWRLSGYTTEGVLNHQVWGMVTFLTDAEAEELRSDVKELQARRKSAKSARGRNPQQAQAIGRDVELYTALLADYYVRHGVLMGAFDLLLEESMDEDAVYGEAGGLAIFFRDGDKSIKGISE